MKKNSKYIYIFVACCFALSGILQWNTTKWAAMINFIVAIIWLIMPHLMHNSKPADFSKLEGDELFLNYLKTGQMSNAIKRCRELTTCSLKDAYDYVLKER